MCPVCTVTVIAGLGLSRLLGIDDVITSLWIGGFILSFSFVTITWIHKKWPNLITKYYYLPTFAIMYLFVLIPLKLGHIIGVYRNTLFGIDKIILGIFVGSIVFLVGVWADKYQRKKFSKIFFPFQKVVFPVACLLVASFVFFFIAHH
jgi:hypothetical protein